MENKEKLTEATILALEGKLQESSELQETNEVICPKCGNKSDFIFDNYGFDEEEDCGVADTECKKCGNKFLTYFEEDLSDCECDDCGSVLGLGDPNDDLNSKTVVYDAICYECGANYDVEGNLNIIGVKQK